jgi:hypothetical protein
MECVKTFQCTGMHCSGPAVPDPDPVFWSMLIRIQDVENRTSSTFWSFFTAWIWILITDGVYDNRKFSMLKVKRSDPVLNPTEARSIISNYLGIYLRIRILPLNPNFFNYGLFNGQLCIFLSFSSCEQRWDSTLAYRSNAQHQSNIRP